MAECVFCEIVKGSSPCHKIYEDENFLAFLSIFPNTKGFSVVISKKHFSSYAFDLPDDILTGLILAAKKVGKLLDSKLNDVGRTGLIFEGFGVDHVHAKLIPLHGTKMPVWKKLHASQDRYFEQYEGYISSHDFRRADDLELAELARLIRE